MSDLAYRSSKELAEFCAQSAQAKNAEDILVLDLKDVDSAPANFFAICSCESEAQIKAIFEDVYYRTKDVGEKSKSEGTDFMQWVLIDFFDVVFHIMLKPKRDFYKIEKLWSDAAFSGLDDSGNLVAMSVAEVKKALS